MWQEMYLPSWQIRDLYFTNLFKQKEKMCVIRQGEGFLQGVAPYSAIWKHEYASCFGWCKGYIWVKLMLSAWIPYSCHCRQTWCKKGSQCIASPSSRFLQYPTIAIHVSWVTYGPRLSCRGFQNGRRSLRYKAMGYKYAITPWLHTTSCPPAPLGQWVTFGR